MYCTGSNMSFIYIWVPKFSSINTEILNSRKVISYDNILLNRLRHGWVYILPHTHANKFVQSYKPLEIFYSLRTYTALPPTTKYELQYHIILDIISIIAFFLDYWPVSISVPITVIYMKVKCYFATLFLSTEKLSRCRDCKDPVFKSTLIPHGFVHVNRRSTSV